LGIGDWGLGIGPNPQSPIPNPQSPIPNPQSPITLKCKVLILLINILYYIYIKILNNLNLMVHFISFGKYNKLYKYIWFFLIICLVNEYIFSDIFPDQIKPYIFETTNYPSNILIQGFFNYLGSSIFSIFLYLYEKSQLQKRENNNESKATSGILYRYEYIYYTKRLVESKINTIIFFSIILIISIESLNIFLLLNLDGITYWSFDLFFLSYINLKLFGVPIYSHKKFSIVFIAVFSTLFLIFSTYELLTNDNYNLFYKNHLFLIPILIVLYQFLSISR